MGRALTLAALALAVIAAGLLMFGSGAGYRVALTLDNAGQLVPGDQVKIGGYPVGEVERIELEDDGRARIELVIDDEQLAPLHEGTVATVRSTSLSGIANRYVALEPGPNDRPRIEDGGRIRTEDGREAVDLDQLLNTLDPQVQRELQTFVREAADLFAEDATGAGGDARLAADGLAAARDANAGLESLNPALAQTARTFAELTRDQRALERIVVRSADVASDVSERPREVEGLVPNALRAVGAIARESSALESSLVRLPPTLRRTNTTLVNLRETLGDLRPLVREARPAAPLLAAAFERLRPLARDARPVVDRTRATIDSGGDSDLLGVLRGLVTLGGEAVPAFGSTVAAVEDALPIVSEARPYVPDVVGGLLHGFGGSTGTYYDANGHYARITFQGSLFTLSGGGSLVPRTPADQTLADYRLSRKRCPGAATQPAPDRSNPYVEYPGFPCDREDTPR